MKRKPVLFSIATLTLILCSLSIIFSCKKHSANLLSGDKCKATSCAYGGVCIEGTCKCAPGYEGNNCEIVSRTKFQGSWNVKEKGSVTEAAEYSMVIEGDTSATVLKIVNFYNYFKTPVRAVISKDTITIPNQQLEGKVVFGTGIIYTDSPGTKYGKISLRYQVIDVQSGLVNDFGYYPDITHSNPASLSKQ
ncbi:MAG: hypothetical protein EBZ77_10170 [Chitinophagia bacterium]|nr:hypothetical protein [Chitinophagia bacterium]